VEKVDNFFLVDKNQFLSDRKLLINYW